jgi:hypothetical protein
LSAVVRCVTDEGFVARQPRQPEQARAAEFRDGFAIVDWRNGQALKLELRHRFVVRRMEGNRGLWTASTNEYAYRVSDERDSIIAAWHWHPMTQLAGDDAPWPHLHTYGARDALTLHKLHLPTGRVSLEAVVRFLISDLDVVPRRADWRAVLDRQEEQFRQTRSWA